MAYRFRLEIRALLGDGDGHLYAHLFPGPISVRVTEMGKPPSRRLSFGIATNKGIIREVTPPLECSILDTFGATII